MKSENALTIAICTLNRADRLRRCLEEFCRLEIPPDLTWELLIIDNGSTDHTGATIQEFTDRLPIRSVFEPQTGLSNARNCAVRNAQGGLILWTDDDVLVDRNWLAAYAAAEQEYPHAAFFGGKIEPLIAEGGPAWFNEAKPLIGNILAARDFGDTSLVLDRGGNALPYGANYAVRRLIQEQFLYNPALGVAAGQRRLGEETEVLERILAAGYQGRWIPAAKVWHEIGLERQSAAYIWNYQFGRGETDALGLWGKTAKGARAVLWRDTIRGVKHYLQYKIAFKSAPAAVWLRHLLASAYCFGTISFLRQSLRSRGTSRPDLETQISNT